MLLALHLHLSVQKSIKDIFHRNVIETALKIMTNRLTKYTIFIFRLKKGH